MEKYNLITTPWIICSGHDSHTQTYSLREVFLKADQLNDLDAPEPIANAALYRLLLAILARVFGPASFENWSKLYQSGKFDPDVLNAYFEKWENRFNLFDEERPFYQCKDDRVKPKPLLKLMPHLASGNNATLFDHNTEDEGITLDAATAARFVVTLQSYGLGGLSGIKEKFTAAPPARGISFMVKGNNLFETLVLNMLRYTTEVEVPIPTEEDDAPCWEMDDPFEDRDIPYGFLDYLTWQNRRVYLFPEVQNGEAVVNQMTEAPGLRMDAEFVNGVSIRDPYQYYRMSSTKAPIVLRFSEGQALWRNSSVLLRQTNADGLKPPPNFSWLSQLVQKELLDVRKTFQVLGLGMAADKAKVLFYGSETFPLPLIYLQDENLVTDLDAALSWAKEVSRGLYGVVSGFAEIILSPESDLPEGRKADSGDKDRLREHFGVDRIYWAVLEVPFFELMQNLPQDRDTALGVWKKYLCTAAWQALEHAVEMAGETPKVWKGAVKARGKLGYLLKNQLEDPQKEEMNV